MTAEENSDWWEDFLENAIDDGRTVTEELFDTAIRKARDWKACAACDPRIERSNQFNEPADWHLRKWGRDFLDAICEAEWPEAARIRRMILNRAEELYGTKA